MAGAAALAGSAAGALFPQEAYAQNIPLPPGIANDKFSPMVKIAYRFLEGETPRGYLSGYSGNEIALATLGLTQMNEPIQTVKSNVPLVDPAYHFTAIKAGDSQTLSKFPKVKKNNPALYYFIKGMNDYFGRWVNYNGYYQKAAINEWVEKNFLKSLYAASEIKNPPSINEYWDYDLHNKKILFKRIMIELRHKDYDRQIVAEWSSTWLGNQYGSLIKEKNDQYYKFTSLVFHSVEKPLWKYVPRVRAEGKEPHYFNQYV